MPFQSLERFHYVEVRTRRIPGRGKEWVVGVQVRKGDKVLRVADPDLGRACAEAIALAEGCSEG